MAKVQVQVWRSVQPGHVQTADCDLASLRHGGRCNRLARVVTGRWLWHLGGVHARLDTVLTSGDRVELYRALTVDPKVARRERFAQQGARGAGLFFSASPAMAEAGY